jgi:hypothetical protein
LLGTSHLERLLMRCRRFQLPTLTDTLGQARPLYIAALTG